MMVDSKHLSIPKRPLRSAKAHSITILEEVIGGHPPLPCLQGNCMRSLSSSSNVDLDIQKSMRKSVCE